MEANQFKTQDKIAWCPGCGNYNILSSLHEALAGKGLSPNELLLVSGIGQAAKCPHYVNANCFNGLHGRALPVAAAAKMVNPDLHVLVTTGDGDCYGEGGNHLLHNIRRNINITVIVHNNQIYGLTKGQASPTTDMDYKTGVQTHGVAVQPFHPLEAAIAMGAGFVARGFSGDGKQLVSLIQQGMDYKGFSLIDVLQPCVSFNKKNTFKWYKDRVAPLGNDYNPADKAAAYEKAAQWGEEIPTGIIYRVDKEDYHRKNKIDESQPLAKQDLLNQKMEDFYNHFSSTI